MTRTNITWDAEPDITKFNFETPTTSYSVNLDRSEVNELALDAREACFLQRGYEKLDLVVASVEPMDKICIGSLELNVSDVLDEKDDKRVIQFGHDQMELVLDRYRLIEVWRVIE